MSQTELVEPRTLVPTVLDVNDETPTFFPAMYNVSVSEDVPREFRVVWLNCTDNDVGLNAELSYFITGEASALSPRQTAPGGPEDHLWSSARHLMAVLWPWGLPKLLLGVQMGKRND